MTSLLAPVIACHHWISVCAAASLAAKSIAPAASQLSFPYVFIDSPPEAQIICEP